MEIRCFYTIFIHGMFNQVGVAAVEMGAYGKAVEIFLIL